MKNIKKIIGENIRQARQKQGFTSNDLARMLNVTNTLVNAIENGVRSITLQNLLLLSFIFDKPVTAFLEGVEIKAEDYLDKNLVSVLKTEMPDKFKEITSRMLKGELQKQWREV